MFLCSFCGKSFHYKPVMQRHEKFHTGEKQFVCQVCKKAFTHKRHLLRHHKTKHRYKCELCNFTFSFKSSLDQHMELHGDTRGNSEVVHKLSSPNEPSAMCPQSKQFQCSICYKEFSVENKLKAHLWWHGSEAAKTFAHNLFGKEFQFQKHLKVRTDTLRAADYQHICRICKKIFKSYRNLISHSILHAEKRMFACSHCNKRFRYKFSLQRHERLHKKESSCIKTLGKPSLCTYKNCVSILADENHLETHQETYRGKCEGRKIIIIQSTSEEQNVPSINASLSPESPSGVLEPNTVLDDKKLFQCSTCLLRFPLKSELKNHIQHNHPTVTKTFQCNLCGKEFSCIKYLKLHVESHFETDPQLVSTDSGKALQNSDLRSVEKLFACSVCGKRFRHKFAMRRHKISHAEEMSFKQSTVYNKHNKAEHQNMLYLDSNNLHSCEVCDLKFFCKSDLGTHQQTCMSEQIETRLNRKSLREQNVVSSPSSPRSIPMSDDPLPSSQRSATSLSEEVASNVQPLNETLHFLSNGANEGNLWQCAVCRDEFPSQRKLMAHFEHHNTTKSFECNLCGKEFDDQEYLQVHIETLCGREPQYMCRVCGIIFQSRVKLLAHSVLHTGEKVFACTFCERIFHHRFAMQRHERSHLGIKPFMCEVCNKSFALRQHLVGHHRSVHPENNPYICEHCGLAFSCKRNLRLHTVLHSQDRIFSCSFCWKSFRQRFAWQRHERSHLGEKPFVCQVCNKAFALRQHLVGHYNGVHSEKKVYFCEFCGLTFFYKRNFNRHKTASNGKCGEISTATKENSERSSLKKEKISVTPAVLSSTASFELKVSSQEELFECPTCHFTFPTQSKLQTHLKKHKTKAPQVYTCNLCGKVLKFKGTLKTHIESHCMTEPQHRCRECGKAFKTRGNLMLHSVLHSEERSFVCSFCKKSFRHRSAMRRHEKSHKGDRPFVCKVCNKTFALRHHLVGHHKAQHPDKSLNSCELCGMSFSYKRDLNQHKMASGGKCGENTTSIKNKSSSLVSIQKRTDVLQLPALPPS